MTLILSGIKSLHQTRGDSNIQTSGNDTITGFNTNDSIRGGAGNDTLNGGTGNDTYYWARGDGNDTITEDATNGGTADKLMLEDVLASSVSLSRTSNHVTLVISESSPGAGNGGLIVLSDEMLTTAQRGLESIQFSDGTIWTQAYIRATLSAAATSSNDVIYGTTAAESINALGGNDTIYADAGNDALEGSTGSDVLVGGAGDDTFIFRPGSGSDTILDFTTHAGTANGDAIQLLGYSTNTFAALVANATEWEGVSYLNLEDGGIIALQGVEIPELTASDFKFS